MMKKIGGILFVAIVLYIIKTIITFIIEFYSLLGDYPKMFRKDPETGGFWSYSRVYMAWDFIGLIPVYILVIILYYYLCKLNWINSWKKKQLTGLVLVLTFYLIYASFEEPVYLQEFVNENIQKNLNMKFIQGIITYTTIGICLPYLSRRIKLI